MMQNRTHTCGELRLSDAGKQVKISGWMENVRVVSANLAFVVVRDFYGTTQVSFTLWGILTGCGLPPNLCKARPVSFRRNMTPCVWPWTL